MKVSIIIPVYHVEKYIRKCVLSVLKQSYRPLEVIFVDDFSEDNSLKIAEETVNEYSGNQVEVKFIKHNSNQGQGIARNTGIDASTGDYLYFLDSDDELEKDAISVLVAQLEKYPQSEIVHGRMVLEDRTDYHRNMSAYREMEFIADNSVIRKIHYSLNGSLPEVACDKLIKKKFVVDNHLYFKKKSIFEDSHWLNFAIKRVNFLSFVKLPTYIRFVNPNSTMTSLNNEREIVNWGIILKDYLLSLDEPCYNEQLYAYLNRFLLYYDSSGGNYGYNDLCKLFGYKFLFRRFFKMAVLLFFYRHFVIVSENRIKARIRGMMYNEIENFYNLNKSQKS